MSQPQAFTPSQFRVGLDGGASFKTTIVVTGAASGLGRGRPRRACDCICLVPIDTPMMAEHERWMGGPRNDAREELERDIRKRRYGSPAEVAELVEFLLLSEVRLLTGAAVAVDDGVLAT